MALLKLIPLANPALASALPDTGRCQRLASGVS